MAWATEAETLALTGATVSTSVLAQSQGIVELYAGVAYGVTGLDARDVRMLRFAVSYQAAWLLSQVDVTSRTEVQSIDQDGVKVVPTDADALILAPLARRAIAGLSWRRRTGTVCVAPGVLAFRTQEEYRDGWMRDETSDRWIEARA